ncbi:hypothetical protein Lal_00041878 [Lupinus albus]|uniref:Uncharacterized protein n=1 Tax=Lupinus albus TaxID=3870 RepID=A0A6A4QUR2_LUPAL|nr:hypothetical protein Lalb_Chr03g0042771 [Lupinus albus]KAF1895597.1 hypothetical protein Lal_00041878 [Lupinus albus]
MKPSEGMGFSLDLRKIGSKRQSRSKTAKESDPPKKPDKLESKTNIGSSCTDPYVIGKIQNQESVKGSSTQHDELVKYMSNLPGFLQHSDRGENIQEKALNFGVLDWSQLEKWKNKQTHMPGVARSFTSFNSSGETSSRSRHKKVVDNKGLYSSTIKASYKEDLPESSKVASQDIKLYQYFEAEPIETKIIEDKNIMRPWESIGKNRSDTSHRKEKRNDCDKIITLGEHFASKSRHHSVSLVPDVEDKKIKEVLQQHSLKKKERNHKSSSHKGLSSLKSKDKGVSYGYQQKMSSSRSKTKKKMDQRKESDFDFPEKRRHRKPSNIVLLRPGQVPQSSSQDYFHLSHFRTSSDEIFSESSGSSLSFSSLPEEVYTEDACFEIPHSSTLPFSAELASSSSSSSETMQHSVNTDQDIDHSSVVSRKPMCSNMMSSLQFEDTSIEKEILDIKLGNQCAFSNTQESLYQETAGLTDQRGRNASSHCRLSFSLNRIGRSLSFKEGSTLPQFSSVNVKAKSGPLTFESSVSLVNSSKEKVNAHNRTRSSSFRWLLDPILKHKVSNIHRSAEISPSTKGNLNSINLHAEKSNGSSIEAILQLTIKNELPLFKFVLSRERKVLVATMKSSREKDDIGCYFAFYHLNEIKKKSGGWMSRGSKEKSCGYVYNIIGQMKFCRSKITEPKNQNSERHCVVKEYVLSGVEVDQTNQGPPIKSEELGAVVIKIPCENFSHEEPNRNDLLDKGSLKCLTDEKCFCSSGENDISFTPTVILPGGVHSFSNQGEPSPLIHRWKSGGLCDCGGWDVGCKLLVLSNQKQCSNVSRSRFQLFVEEGAEHNTPLFSLAPSTDGFYSVEFSSTISHLQAFFISVVLLSSQKLPSTMNKNELPEKASINYNPIPPLSPVGRV